MRRLLLIASLFGGAANAQSPDGCPTTPITCNQTVSGALAPGDCVRADGTFADAYTFTGAATQYVRAIVYPRSPTLTNLTLGLSPASGPSRAPQTSGTKGAEIAYVLPSGGPWTLTVGSRDPLAAGDYLLEMTCTATNISPSYLQACTTQKVMCGQTVDWSLSPQESCRFHDGLDLAYEFFSLYGDAGETLTLDAESAEFSPRIRIYYGGRGGSPIARSILVSPAKDRLVFTLPKSGVYDVAVSSRPALQFGRFRLTVQNCASGGCLPPIITQQPADVVVPFGTAAKLSATAIAAGSVRYIWFDRTGLPAELGEGQTFTTPRITGTQYFSVSAVTPCGGADSRIVTVRPTATTAPAHRRAIRH